MLDELGETSPAFQVKLLRVLEEREYQPLGSVEKHTTNVRIIAATNRDLAHLVEEGSFRRDLFYRVNIVRLQLPPLRERMEDIPLLADHFIGKMNRLRGKAVSYLSEESLEVLMRHSFPGNIRELENIIEHAFILCSSGPITLNHLPQSLLHIDSVPPASPQDSGQLQHAVHNTEIEQIQAALQRNDYNRTAAARDLGMHKTTFFRKVKRLGITLPSRDGRHIPGK